MEEKICYYCKKNYLPNSSNSVVGATCDECRIMTEQYRAFVMKTTVFQLWAESKDSAKTTYEKQTEVPIKLQEQEKEIHHEEKDLHTIETPKKVIKLPDKKRRPFRFKFFFFTSAIFFGLVGFAGFAYFRKK